MRRESWPHRPSSEDRPTLKSCEAGVDVCRFNYSHGEPATKPNCTVGRETSRMNSVDQPAFSPISQDQKFVWGPSPGPHARGRAHHHPPPVFTAWRPTAVRLSG